MEKGPVLIEIDDAVDTKVADAPPVPDIEPVVPNGQAMQVAAQLAARRPSRLARWFWALLGTLTGALVSLAAWDFVTGLITRNPILGWSMTALIGAFVIVLVGIALRELATFSRLARIDSLRHSAGEALSQEDLSAARKVVTQLMVLYRNRDDTKWGRDRLLERQSDQFDADSLLGLAEAELMVPMDVAASREVEAAARQVATITALVPIALADVAAALSANLRMIRRIAEIYGGRRSGTLGNWRLTRAVMSHLVATGAV
ncbi:MAG: TIGR01620 family protein, partial [Paracoccaceae bacterium]